VSGTSVCPFTADDVEASVARVVGILTPAWARHWAARYNAPVYLTGSILENPMARDVDIRIPVPDHAFAARFGNAIVETTTTPGWTKHVDWAKEGPTQRWVDEIAKVNEWLSTMLERTADLQIWPASYWREPYPKPLLLAAPTPKWWIYSIHCPEPVLREATHAREIDVRKPEPSTEAVA
jgi:hypothetical protein